MHYTLRNVVINIFDLNGTKKKEKKKKNHINSLLLTTLLLYILIHYILLFLLGTYLFMRSSFLFVYVYDCYLGANQSTNTSIFIYESIGCRDLVVCASCLFVGIIHLICNGQIFTI